MIEIKLERNKKIYFASDFHLGAPNYIKSLEREKLICEWLDSIKSNAQMIFLVGDLFDFWFEYKNSIPKGYTRFFGKLAEIADLGIGIVIFTGNHDVWMKNYFTIEFGAQIFRQPQVFHINNKKIYIGHGDGLGPGDYAYKVLKKVFENRICKFLFGTALHPTLALKLGYAWAGYSWSKHEKEKDVYVFESNEKEILYHYCLSQEKKSHHDFYVFGHRHYTFDININQNSRYINLGDWIRFNSYGVFEENEMRLKYWKN